MGLFKSLFGKPDEDPYAGLSAEAIRQKIAGQNQEIEQLKHKLPSAGALESMAKSAAWSAEMQAKIKAASAGGDLDGNGPPRTVFAGHKKLISPDRFAWLCLQPCRNG
jgi:hypothetical protein